MVVMKLTRKAFKAQRLVYAPAGNSHPTFHFAVTATLPSVSIRVRGKFRNIAVSSVGSVTANGSGTYWQVVWALLAGWTNSLAPQLGLPNVRPQHVRHSTTHGLIGATPQSRVVEKPLVS